VETTTKRAHLPRGRRRQKSDLSLRWQAQKRFSELYERDHRVAEADKQYQRALATIEQSRATLQHEEFKLPFLATPPTFMTTTSVFSSSKEKTSAPCR